MTNEPAMTPEVERALQEASVRVEELRVELRAAYPALRGTLAIPGVFIGHSLGSFVANGMTDDQIVAHVLGVVAELRQAKAKLQDILGVVAELRQTMAKLCPACSAKLPPPSEDARPLS